MSSCHPLLDLDLDQDKWRSDNFLGAGHGGRADAGLLHVASLLARGGSGRANLCHMTQFVSSVRQLATRNLCRVPFVSPRKNSGIAPINMKDLLPTVGRDIAGDHCRPHHLSPARFWW